MWCDDAAGAHAAFYRFLTHVDSVNIDSDVGDGDGVLVAFELHLQHPLEAPAHEGDIGDPGRHWGSQPNESEAANLDSGSTPDAHSPSHMLVMLMTKPPVR